MATGYVENATGAVDPADVSYADAARLLREMAECNPGALVLLAVHLRRSVHEVEAQAPAEREETLRLARLAERIARWARAQRDNLAAGRVG